MSVLLLWCFLCQKIAFMWSRLAFGSSLNCFDPHLLVNIHLVFILILLHLLLCYVWIFYLDNTYFSWFQITQGLPCVLWKNLHDVFIWCHVILLYYLSLIFHANAWDVFYILFWSLLWSSIVLLFFNVI